MFSTLFRRATRLAALSGLLWACGAHAQQATPLDHLITPLQLHLEQAPDLVLSRDRGERTLQVVTDRATPVAAVAHRYGLTGHAVTVVQEHPRTQVLQLALPARLAERQPVRPRSVALYRVRSGDTMARVAARFGVSLVDLLGMNLDRTSLDHLKQGSTLNVPTGPTGLLVRIKPGQNALSLIAGYGADLLATAQANDVLPTELKVGDQLLLPGIRAEGFAGQLAEKRDAERRAALAAQRQQQYEKFLTWKQQRQRARLEAKFAAQARYEAYLAWKSSPERQAKIAAYERQAQFEAAQAAARTRARLTARQNAQRSTVSAASTHAGPHAATGSGGLVWPMRSFRITSRYAERDIEFHRQVFHGGVDFAAPYGTPIYAAAAGTVTQSGYGAYGLNVFTSGGNSTLVYGHMSRTAVAAGQQVQQGQLLGYVGCTGICTGPHLHFEVRLGGQTVDPLTLLP
ncbi:peptidoglycan DD-metalloendopeptidase family protein [Deinococcus taeanensis]|uniref:peptidoglycan DD-metalloendopeptidase family protein n=1 Tax=Deinococcus taeanensis TaxID=2737050 RepID=UPI001CDC5816|nr:M23 family metallopeptidase [Deinococcus taeanensis]UBV43592.1 peptidoglycan DD-metalloendopeptidase family protein [Deinococcus taeanensis]